jgi:hypothetical protein
METQIDAFDIRIGDTIKYEGVEFIVNYVGLYRGVSVELHVRNAGMYGRALPEKTFILPKYSKITKIV